MNTKTLMELCKKADLMHQVYIRTDDGGLVHTSACVDDDGFIVIEELEEIKLNVRK